MITSLSYEFGHDQGNYNMAPCKCEVLGKNLFNIQMFTNAQSFCLFKINLYWNDI